MLANFILQKSELLKRAGLKSPPVTNWERAKHTHGKYMEAAAVLADRWLVDYDVFMEAAFSWASKQRQPDGPFPQLLGSAKYMTKALQHHLQLPYEVIVEGRSRADLVRRMDEDYEEHKATLKRSCESLTARGGVIEDLTLLAGVDPVHLLVFVMETLEGMPVPDPVEVKLRDKALAAFIPAALPALARSKTAALWVKDRYKGRSYEELADFYNEHK